MVNYNILGFVIYILLLIIYALLLPEYFFDPYQKKLIFLLGAVGVWRYSWLLNNALRAYIYKTKVFSKIREAEESLKDELDPKHIFLLITTFRIGSEVSAEVYRSAIREAIECGYDVTIISSLVEMSEERLVRKIFLSEKPPKRVKLVIAKERGSGKRDGLSLGFRVIANTNVDLFNSVVAVIDGDSILESGLIRKCARLFALDKELGGLTTDEDAKLVGNDFSTAIYNHWYKLRFAQRNISMCSMALSDKVLTLTGRMSMIRANIVAEEGFIKTVQADHINHPRLGEFQFLTGDDKSSWYYVMKNGWKIWYVPDVTVWTVEEIPDKNWFRGSIVLMRRWFGNQYRTNERALKVPIEIIGYYPKYALIDQRVTRWTSIYGLLIAIFGSIHWGLDILIGYLWWIMFSRLFMIYIYRFSRKEILPSWMFLIYYNQIVGSFVKIYVWNHLYKQKWTRQKTTLDIKNRFINWYYETSSNGTFIIELLILVIITNFLVQNITFDQDVWNIVKVIKGGII